MITASQQFSGDKLFPALFPDLAYVLLRHGGQVVNWKLVLYWACFVVYVVLLLVITPATAKNWTLVLY